MTVTELGVLAGVYHVDEEFDFFNTYRRKSLGGT